MNNGKIVATAVLGLFGAMGCAAETDSDDKEQSQDLVQCEGINSCEGTSDCASTDGSSSCEGMNSCEGQGFLLVTEEECEEQEGTIREG